MGFLDEFKKCGIVILVNTKDELIDFLEECALHDIRWTSGALANDKCVLEKLRIDRCGKTGFTVRNAPFGKGMTHDSYNWWNSASNRDLVQVEYSSIAKNTAFIIEAPV